MKKLLLIALLSGTTVIKAQETATSERQNDIMISPIELITSSVLNIL